MKNDFIIGPPSQPKHATESLTLARLEPGSEAVVGDVRRNGAVGHRLLDLGLVPGTPIKALRRAPLGDPIVYELRGYQLCLRRVDAELVGIRPGPALGPKTPS
jgi:Fe2+ transport system protein FeoA